MQRVTKKALRSREYIFQNVPLDRQPRFMRSVRILRNTETRLAEKERRRAAERARESSLRASQYAGLSESSLADQGRSSNSNSLLVALLAERSSLACERERLMRVLGKDGGVQ